MNHSHLELGTTIRKSDDFKLAMTHAMVSERFDPNFKNGFKIERLGRNFGVPQIVIDCAETYFKKVRTKEFKFKIGVGESCLLLACRQHGVALSVKELSSLYERISAKKLLDTMYEIAEFLQIEIPRIDYNRALFNAVRQLKLSNEYYHNAFEIATRFNKDHPNGHNPKSILAVSLYALCKRVRSKRTQLRVAEAFGIAEFTVREAWQKNKLYLMNISQ